MKIEAKVIMTKVVWPVWLRRKQKYAQNHKRFYWFVFFQLKPPFVPKTKHAGDDSNFAKYDEPPLNVSKQCLFEREFRDF